MCVHIKCSFVLWWHQVDFSTGWFAIKNLFLSFQLGNARHIRKISFFQHVGGGRGHNGELWTVLCGLITRGVRWHKGNDTQMWWFGLFIYWDNFHFIWIEFECHPMVQSCLSGDGASPIMFLWIQCHKIREYVCIFWRSMVVVFWNSCSRISFYDLCLYCMWVTMVCGCLYVVIFLKDYFIFRTEGMCPDDLD